MNRILVIDDNPSVRHIVRATLRSSDLEVLEAGTAGEGLSSARCHAPELVICDLNLGDSTGWDVLEGMRRDAAMATIPVILITGDDDGATMRRGMDLGADDFLTKPFTRDQLVASVQARLRKRGAVRQQTEQANRRLLELLEATGDMVAIVDARTRTIRYLNRTARRVTGLDPDHDGQPIPLSAFYPAQAYAVVVEQGLERALSTGSWSGETDVSTREGGTIHVLQEILAHPTEDGVLDCFSLVARDITARQQAERAVRESETRLRGLTEQMPQAVFVKDVDSRFVSCNQRFARSLGCDPSDIIGKDDFAFYPRALAEKFRADDRAVMESNRTWQTEEKTLTHGTERWVRTTKLPYRDGLGGVIGVMCIFEDITERRRGEDRLRALSRAIEQSPITIMITDPEGVIEYVNPKFCQVTGYTAEEVMGRTPSLLKSGKTPGEVYRQLWTTIVAGQTWRGSC